MRRFSSLGSSPWEARARLREWLTRTLAPLVPSYLTVPRGPGATSDELALGIARSVSVAPRMTVESTPSRVHAAVEALCAVPSTDVFRREALREFRRTIHQKSDDPAASYSDAAWRVRNRTRTGGARLPRLGIGTTLRIKGLEFDHAILVDADGPDFDRKNLYVALTRGCETLTVFSKDRVISAAG